MQHLINVETERIIIRPYKTNDLEKSYKLMQDKELYEFLHFDVMTFEEYQFLFNWLLQSYDSVGNNFKYSFAIFLKDTNELIGWVGIGNLDCISGEKEIYYLIGKQFQGKGYAFEAAREIIKYGFTNLGLNRIVAKVNPKNIASKRIIEKLGFNFEYVLENLTEEHAECNGEYLYSLIK